jgi:bifunctional ADP-heptose synthase (sugar kinase/adenylyltransferase)
VNRFKSVCEFVDAVIVMDQVDLPETGVVTQKMLEAIRDVAQAMPRLLILADSRRGLRGYPPVTFKMNAAELSALTGTQKDLSLDEIKAAASALAQQHGRAVFVTVASQGILAAAPTGAVEHVSALPVRGEIDVVGAGDAVTANLTAALAAGATIKEALILANVAASIVIHQLGTTGTAIVSQLAEWLPAEG